MRNKDLNALSKLTKLMRKYGCKTHIIIRPGGVYDLKVVAIGGGFRFVGRSTKLKKLLKEGEKALNRYIKVRSKKS